MFTSTHREKQGWGTDYPGADINFSIRVSELTKIQVKMIDDGDDESDPDAVVVRLTDEALFNCPFIFMEDAGTARLQLHRKWRGCRTTCSRAAFCWSPTITAPTGGSNSTTRSAACCRRRATPSST